MKEEDKTKWVSAMTKEMLSHLENDVFDVALVPEKRILVACRWLFALKRN